MTHLVPVLRPVLGSPFRRSDLYRIAGAMPALHLSPRLRGDWTDLISGIDPTTFSRANTAPTCEQDGAGGLVAFTSGQRAIGYSHETGIRGGSIFGQRTQLLANPDAPATQSVTLSAVQHQLTLFGTGSVTLSGAATGTLTGTGASNRVSLSFTPTAGSVTFTVSGSVSRFNLTAGAVVYPHLGGAITCPADVLSIDGTNFSQWYQQAGGTLLVSASRQANISSGRYATISDGTMSNRIQVGYSDEANANLALVTASALQYDIYITGLSGIRKRSLACALKAGTNSFSVNGSTLSSGTAATMPTVNSMRIGAFPTGGDVLNGHIHDILYWPPGSPAEQRLQQLSAFS